MMITGISAFEWREPAWLWLALFPWALLLARQLLAGRLAKDYADQKLLPWALARHAVFFRRYAIWRHVLFGIAWLLFAAALAGPRVAQTVFDADQSHYGKLVLAIDVSRSMTADDISPNRLQRIKLELLDLIERIDQTRVGLVVYAARPHLLAPFTADKSLLRFYVRQLRYGLLPTHGSDLRAALAFSGDQLGNNAATRSILIISDGEVANDTAAEEYHLDQTVTRLRQQGVTVYALGAGTRKGAAVLSDDGSWLRYQGKEVVSRLHTTRLQRIASLGGGSYSEIRNSDAEWRNLYDRGIAREQTRSAVARGTGWIIWQDYFSWFLIPAMLFWLAAYIRTPHRGHSASLLVIVLVAFTLLTPDSDLQAADNNWQQRAYQAYEREAYQDARQWYARVSGYDGRMGEGSSSYRLGKFDQAIRQFVRATLDANSDPQRADALFNLANSYFKLSRYQEAVEIYRDALRYRPEDENITRNLTYAVAMIKNEEERAAMFGRPGTGPRSLTPLEGSDISEAGVMLDTDGEAERTPVPSFSETPPAPDSDLVRDGIRRAELAATNIEQSEDPTWTYDISSTEGVALKAAGIQVDESILWQRMLEYEEEFPVLVETPYELPGVQPW
ncbi:MAG: VWA domain-containing protein [Acidiferrobacterales bacterium]|nr:VWA domain-containing protein [Acidiferrobacterales bacterium]